MPVQSSGLLRIASHLCVGACEMEWVEERV